MAWIWQAPQWPNFQFDAQALQPTVAAARLAQGRMLGLASQLQLVDLSELQISGVTAEAMATAQIEGELLHPQSVRLSAARRLGLAELARPPIQNTTAARPPRPNFKKDNATPLREEATLDVVHAAITQWPQPLALAQLLGWHAALFPTGFSGVTPIAAGAWRTHTEPMQIVTPRIGKPDIVHYQAPPSAEVPGHMAQLVAWFNTSQAQMDGLVRAALAHLWLEAIHPFEDGNGRIGRALSDLALAQDAHSSQYLFSLSHQLLAQRKSYYDELQAATGSASLDVTAWVRWFVERVQQACEHSVAHMQAALGKSRFWQQVQAAHPAITASQRKVLNTLFDAQVAGSESGVQSGFQGGLSTEKYVALSGVSRATAYRELTALVSAGLLVKAGLGRGTRYGLGLHQS